MDLKTRLARSARAWCASWSAADGADVPLSRLSKRVVDDGKFFDNLLAMRRGPSTDTLEKFAAFLVDASNWPEGVAVPAEVIAFGHAVGVSAPCPAPATGQVGELSGREAAA